MTAPVISPTVRAHTPDRILPNGMRRIAVQRCCSGCGQALGDATDAELGACVDGSPLPDTTAEHGCGGAPPAARPADHTIPTEKKRGTTA